MYTALKATETSHKINATEVSLAALLATEVSLVARDTIRLAPFINVKDKLFGEGEKLRPLGTLIKSFAGPVLREGINSTLAWGVKLTCARFTPE